MTSVLVPLVDTNTTIDRYIVKSVLEQLLHLTSLSVEDIVYKDPAGNAGTFRTYNGNSLKLSSADYLIVDYTVVGDDETLDVSRHNTEYPPIFNRPDLGLRIEPMHAVVEYEINITVRLQSYNRLMSWLFRLRQQLVSKAAVNTHDLQYLYAIPAEIIAYLSNVHTAINDLDTISVDDFLTDSFGAGFLLRSNLLGSRLAAVMNVLNTGVVGGYSPIPRTPTVDQDDDFAEVEFTYKIKVQRPTVLRFKYQSFIYNQIVPIDMLAKFYIRTPDPLPQYGAQTTASSAVSLVTKTMAQEPPRYIPWLYTDDLWVPKLPSPDTHPLVITPIALDPLNPTALVNLLNVTDGPSLLLDVLNRIAANDLSVNLLYASPYLVEVWEVGAVEQSLPLLISPTLDVTTSVTPELRRRHYLVVSLITDLSRVDLQSLIGQPTLLLEILQVIEPNITALDFRDADRDTHLGTTQQLVIVHNGSKVYLPSLIHVVKNLATTNLLYASRFHLPVQHHVQLTSIHTHKVKPQE